MDSRELFDIVYPSPLDRTYADAMMNRALAWVGRAVPPEYVYGREHLDAWALRNGYERKDSTELVDLLRQAQPHIVAYTPLSVAINNAIVARRSLT